MRVNVARFVQRLTTRNVIAETDRGASDNVVVVGAHLDSVLEGPGINDTAPARRRRVRLLLLLALVYPGAMGMGDVKLALLLGVALGSAVVPALVLGTIAAALAGVALLVREGRSARGRSLPFGPFLGFGAVAAILLLTP